MCVASYLLSGEDALAPLQRSFAIVGGSRVAAPAFWAAARITSVFSVIDLLYDGSRSTCDRQHGRLARVAAEDAVEDLTAPTRAGRHGER